MSDFNNRKEALEEKISDLEETLATLKAQLKAESEREQHEQIDKLDEYLGAVDHKYANLQDFWQVMREELKQLFTKDSTKAEGKQ